MLGKSLFNEGFFKGEAPPWGVPDGVRVRRGTLGKKAGRTKDFSHPEEKGCRMESPF